MNLQLPTPVQWAINRLTSCQFEAYAVGGCVRDTLLGIQPHDWDVTTSATPREVIDCFADVRVVTTGLKHGTVTAMLSGQAVEITTFRVDGGYADHRRPDNVRFTASLTEDLARRDFTINAMAYRPSSGLIDPFGGREDVAAGIIRCVGDPDARFSEDALRMLRALRFASRFGSVIEPETAAAMLRHKDELRYVSGERVLSELSDMDFARIDARFVPVLAVVVPGLTRLDARPGLPPEPAIRLASLLKGLDAEAAMTRWKASKALTQRVTMLVQEAEDIVPPDAISVRRLLSRVGPGAAVQLLILQDNEAAQPVLREVLQRGDAYSVGQLAIGGKALVKMGLSGKQVGLALDALLAQVIDGELPNEERKLLKAVEIAVAVNGLL